MVINSIMISTTCWCNKHLQVEDDDVDDPDLSLRLGEGLREHTGGEITTVVANAADASIYRSAAAFEDIITDKNLLRVRRGWLVSMLRTWQGVLGWEGRRAQQPAHTCAECVWIGCCCGAGLERCRVAYGG